MAAGTINTGNKTMLVTLSPSAAFTDDTPPTVSGSTLSYRGESYDLSQLPDGAEVEAESPFIGKIKRVAGQIELTLQYQYDMTTAEDNQPTDWDVYTFTVTDGQCPCPIIRKEVVNDN
jgi:hypothetical protein